MPLNGYLIPIDQSLNTYMRNTKWIKQVVYMCLCVSFWGGGREKRERENNNNKIMRGYEIESVRVIWSWMGE